MEKRRLGNIKRAGDWIVIQVTPTYVYDFNMTCNGGPEAWIGAVSRKSWATRAMLDDLAAIMGLVNANA